MVRRGIMAAWHTGLSDPELDEIEQRALNALDALPRPWLEFLETRQPIGGSSFVRCGDDPSQDLELHVQVTVNGGDWPSPDIRLDAVVDFIAHTARDVPRLLREVRMLRSDAD
jgi:hypothetical protein